MKDTNFGIRHVLLAVFVYLFYLIFKPFLGVIVLAAIFALVGYPLHRKFRSKVGSSFSSVILTVLVLVLIVGPLAFLMGMISREAFLFVQNFDVDSFTSFLDGIQRDGIFGFEIDIESMKNSVIEGAKNFGGFVASSSGRALSAIANSLGLFFVFLLMLFYFLRDGEKLSDGVLKVLPYSKKEKTALVDAFVSTSKTVFVGNFTSAFISGVIAYIGFLAFGLEAPVIWGLLAALMSLIPTVGNLFLYVFALVIVWASGGWAIALGFAVYYLVLEIGLVENLVKPKLIEDRLGLHPVFVFLALVGGVNAFGAMGILYGPIVLTFLASSYKFYVNGK